MDLNLSSFPIDYLKVKIAVAGYINKVSMKDNVPRERVISVFRKLIESSKTSGTAAIQEPFETTGKSSILKKIEISQADSGYVDDIHNQDFESNTDQLLESMRQEYDLDHEPSSQLSIQERDSAYSSQRNVQTTIEILDSPRHELSKSEYAMKIEKELDGLPTAQSEEPQVEEEPIDEVHLNDVVRALRSAIRQTVFVDSSESSGIGVYSKGIKGKTAMAIDLMRRSCKMIGEDLHGREDKQGQVVQTVQATFESITDYLVDTNVTTRKRDNQTGFDIDALRFATAVDKIFTDCVNGQCMIDTKRLCDIIRTSFRKILSVWMRKGKYNVLDEHMVFNRTIRLLRAFVEQLQCVMLLTLITQVVYEVSASYTKQAHRKMIDPKYPSTPEMHQRIARINGILYGMSHSCNEQMRRASASRVLLESNSPVIDMDEDLPQADVNGERLDEDKGEQQLLARAEVKIEKKTRSRKRKGRK